MFQRIPLPGLLTFLAMLGGVASASQAQEPPPKKEPAAKQEPSVKKDAAGAYTRTEVMIPMRDGIKLYTVYHVPAEAKEPLPFLLTRTPYGAGTWDGRRIPEPISELARDGYIFVSQDIRGRFKSEGNFVVSAGVFRDKSDPKSTNEASDTFDTIEWLLKNVPNNNGRVGMTGVSYPGWLTALAAIDPHPALRAASPQSSPADQFLGDDFHHNGAFRLSYGFEYVAMMETDKTNSNFKFDTRDTYEWYLKLGALSNVNAKHFMGKMPSWNDFVKHPNYDSFWQKQSLLPYLDKPTVPTLNVTGWFDQEDFNGPLKIYETLERKDADNKNFLVVGPWNHGGWSGGRGNRLGKIAFDSDTAKHFREKIQAPFFAFYLKDRGKLDQPEAIMFQTGSNKWVEHKKWPPALAVARKLYFQPDGRLAFAPPVGAEEAFDAYRSDPANPVPYRPRPVRPTYPGPEWRVHMVEDQRFTHRRPDVLSYETEPLKDDVVIAGPMTAKLFAATSGTDSDWIVRLIDVYPEDYPKEPEMGGYQLLISGEPIRGRFRRGFEKPEAIVPDRVEEYSIDLHWSHHCFRKGHKIMVQVSSSWFPLIDRNPQKFVPNIFEAEDSDFQPARQRVFRSPKFPSNIELTTLPGDGERK